jgi:hypothetical protein
MSRILTKVRSRGRRKRARSDRLHVDDAVLQRGAAAPSPKEIWLPAEGSAGLDDLYVCVALAPEGPRRIFRNLTRVATDGQRVRTPGAADLIGVSARWRFVGVTHHFTASSSDSSAPGLPLLARRARLRAHPILRVATRRRGAATANKIRGSHCRSGNSARVSSAVSMSALHASGPPGQSPLARRILGLARLRCSGPPSDACPKDKRCDAVWRQDQRKHSKDHERRRFHQDLRDQRQARSRDRACPDSARVVWRVKSYSSSLRFKDGAAAACARAWTGAPTAARGALLQRFPAKAAAARNPRIAGIRSARFAGHCGAQDRGCGAGDEGRTPALGRCRRFVRLAPRAAQRRSQPAQACATDTDT